MFVVQLWLSRASVSFCRYNLLSAVLTQQGDYIMRNFSWNYLLDLKEHAGFLDITWANFVNFYNSCRNTVVVVDFLNPFELQSELLCKKVAVSCVYNCSIRP